MGKYMTKLHTGYTLFAEESHHNASMPNFAKVVFWHFTSMVFRVSCKVPHQAFNCFHFPIVKANWNRCITCLWIITIQSWNAILMLHILVTFVRYLKCGIKYDLLNLTHWPSNNRHFIYMENSLFNIAYYVYPRNISIGIMTGCRSILSTSTWRM